MSSFIFDGQTAVVPFPVAFPLICVACDRAIKESAFKRDVFRHSRVCRQRDPGCREANKLVFECIYCKFLTSDRRKATTHQGSHFGDPSVQVTTYPCPSCNSSFGTQKALSSHRRKCKVTLTLASEARLSPPPASSSVPPAPPAPPLPLLPIEETVAVAETADDLLSVSTVSSTPLAELDDTDAESVNHDSYERHENDLNWQGEECDEWMNALLPPKEKMKRNTARRSHHQQSRMTAAELQKLYSKDMKAALKRIEFVPEIVCQVNKIDLRYGLLQQLSAPSNNGASALTTRHWLPCNEGREELARRFTLNEVERALEHKNSAPGPDGWTYDKVRREKDFAKKFTEGLHAMGYSSLTPTCWKSYNSMMLFKKPEEYTAGQERELRYFRPIALSNVSYKLLASILYKRLSKWLEANKGIGFCQRAAFGRRGVSENTLAVGNALKKKKTVIYLDLSDAFNSVDQKLIFEALKQCNCPEWIVQLIKSMYAGCKTTPVSVEGEELAGPVPVTRGVKQGCPLSGLLFNLVLDPVLKEATSANSVCLGYMDDLAIIIDEESKVQDVFNRTVKLAKGLGFSFNAKKCGVANLTSTSLDIDGTPIPVVQDDRAYKYLGTEAFPSTVQGLESCFEKALRTAELIEYSELTPMQKLHALRVKIYPMLFHLLENSSSTITQLEKMNRKLRKMAKRILCLPERAASSYLHLHRMYGGPGLPDLVIAKSKMALQTLVRSLNTTGQFGDYLRRLLLENKDLQSTLEAINNGNTKGLCDTIKEASRSLHRLKKFLQVDLQLTILEERDVTLAIDGSRYRDPWPVFSRCLQKQSLKELQKAPNQGRFWRTLAETPLTTKAVFNFHTKLCDFRFIHRARLNLVPVRANNVWNPPENQNCRRCQADRETLNHTLSNCSVMRKKIIQRHNDVRDLLATSFHQRLRILKEQRFGNMQPDLIVQDDHAKQAAIIDIKVSAESSEAFQWNLEQMTRKYDNLRRAYEVSGFSTSINTIQFGTLGSFSRSSFPVLKKFIIGKRDISIFVRKASSLVIHHSRNISTEHLTGVQQNY